MLERIIIITISCDRTTLVLQVTFGELTNMHVLNLFANT